MNSKDLELINEEMRELFKKDKTLTHIEIIFNIQPVEKEKKTAIINIKTYKDVNNSKRKL